MAEEVRMRFGTATTKRKFYCAKNKALRMVASYYTKSYAKLNAYATMLQMTNKGATVKIQYDLQE